jgi:hypothetical protein
VFSIIYRSEGMSSEKLYVFIDESGTHALKVPDEENPLFCLAACLFRNDRYKTVETQIAEFKQKYLGHAHVPLHLYNIRSKDGPFKFLRNPELRRNFNTDLIDTLSKITTKIIACVVDKRALLNTYGSSSWNPYHYALECILERVFLESRGTPLNSIHCIAEKRGKKEDNKFRAKFDEVTMYGTYHVNVLEIRSKNWELEIVSKNACEPGLEIADLVAAPIRNRCANKTDPLWDIIEPKIRRNSIGRIEGWGLIRKP